MSKLATTIFVAVTLACGTGAFYITRLIAAPTPNQDTSSCSWLNMICWKKGLLICMRLI